MGVGPPGEMGAKPVLPNFFIVGAAKSGTTSLYGHLRGHPEVFLPERKEPHFFVDFPTKGIKDRNEYERLFEGGRGAKAIGDASTGYLYAEESPRRIHAMVPDARIIILLRNPVDMAYSLWYHNVRHGKEDLSFEEAVEAEPLRRADPGRLPAGTRWPYNHYYVDRALYFSQVKRYVDTFGMERLFVRRFEDMKNDTAGLVVAVERFLGIADGYVPDLTPRNRGVTPRSSALAGFLARPPGWILTLGHCFPQAVRRRLTGLIDMVNDRPAPRMDLRTRAALQERFNEDMRRLAGLLDWDLSAWMAPVAGKESRRG